MAVGSGTITDRGVSITAPHELVVVGSTQELATTDSYLAVPDDALGTSYHLPAYQGGGFTIVAAEDDTQVWVRATGLMNHRQRWQTGST